MREIKFRAWDKVHKEMIEVEKIDFVHNRITWDDDIISGPIENYPIMQFTGMKDSKGKEIFEGDIIKGTNQLPVLIEDIRMVEWLFNQNDLRIVIIGNKYQTPGLMEKKNGGM